MGVVEETVHELLSVLMDVGVDGDVVLPLDELRARRQLTEEDQVRGLQVRALGRQLLDRVAAVPKDAPVAIDVGDLAAAGGGVGKGRVVQLQPEVVVVDLNLAEVHRADGAVFDRHLVGSAGAIIGDGERLFAHIDAPFAPVAYYRIVIIDRKLEDRQ